MLLYIIFHVIFICYCLLSYSLMYTLIPIQSLFNLYLIRWGFNCLLYLCYIHVYWGSLCACACVFCLLGSYSILCFYLWYFCLFGSYSIRWFYLWYLWRLWHVGVAIQTSLHAAPCTPVFSRVPTPYVDSRGYRRNPTR
jgi:hypothetical protein